MRNAADASESDKPADEPTSVRDRTGPSVSVEASVEPPPHAVGDVDLLSVMQRIDPYDFEHLVADLWSRMGWQTTVSDESVDEGVDVIAAKSTPYEQTTLIQAKRYGPHSTVGSPDVQQYASLKNQYDGVDKVVIATTGGFSDQAHDLAARLNVKLIDGEDLVALIAEHDAVDLVAAYTNVVLDQDDGERESAPLEPNPDDVEPSTGSTRASGAETQMAEPATEGGPVPETRWHYGVAAGFAGWMLVLSVMDWFPDGVVGPLMLISWLLVPLSMYKDIGAIPQWVGWPMYRRAIHSLRGVALRCDHRRTDLPGSAVHDGPGSRHRAWRIVVRIRYTHSGVG